MAVPRARRSSRGRRAWILRHVAPLLFLTTWLVDLALAQATTSSSVGLPARIEELVLPAPELEAVPYDRSQPLLLRIVSRRPHGTAFRYDLEFTGFEPGDYDLRDYLRPLAGAAPAELPAIAVQVTTILPQGQVLPHPPQAARVRPFGGYVATLVLAGVLWVVGLWWILRSGRRPAAAAGPAAAATRSLADQLRPLVERASRGALSTAEQAELELCLLAVWRRRLQIEDLPPEKALSRLREDPEAGALVLQLERWLHAPPDGQTVDLATLLAPYKDLPAMEMLEPSLAGEGSPA